MSKGERRRSFFFSQGRGLLF